MHIDEDWSMYVSLSECGLSLQLDDLKQFIMQPFMVPLQSDIPLILSRSPQITGNLLMSLRLSVAFQKLFWRISDEL